MVAKTVKIIKGKAIGCRQGEKKTIIISNKE